MVLERLDSKYEEIAVGSFSEVRLPEGQPEAALEEPSLRVLTYKKACASEATLFWRTDHITHHAPIDNSQLHSFSRLLCAMH